MSCPVAHRSRRSLLSVGFTLVELAVVLGIIAVLAAVSVPALLSYWDGAALQAAARELASAINLGRHLAIATKTPICVEVTGSALRLRIGGCGGTAWTGAVTDGSGAIHVSGAAILHGSSNARVVFTALGAASPAGTYTLTHVRTRVSRSVVVAASGRVSVE